MLRKLLALFGLSIATAGCVPANERAAYEKAFAPGFHTDVEIFDVGRLKIPSGRIIGFDGFGPDSSIRVLAVRVSPGEYAVRVATSKNRIGGTEYAPTVALARVDFSEGPAVRWEPALWEGETAQEWEASAFRGVSTDTASVGLADPAAVGWLTANFGESSDSTARDLLIDRLLAESDRRQVAKGRRASGTIVVDTGSTTNAVILPAPGDGSYELWLGYDLSGHLVALVADFQALPSESR